MNTKDFFKILKEPTQLKEEQITELEDVVYNFPYFQAARVLYLKGLKNQNSFRYNNSLKTTALHTTNRSVLFHFITSDTFYSSTAEKEESKIIQELESIDKSVLKNINKKEITKRNDHLNELTFEPDTKKIEYIDETAIESLQKEIALNAHSDKLKKDTEQNKILFKIPKSDALSFEIDPNNPIYSIEKGKQTQKNIGRSSANQSEIRFELIQEEITEESSKKSIDKEQNISIDLDIEKPIDFKANETHSFTDWLQLSSFKPINRTVSKKTKQRDRNRELIDDFIEKNPRIKPSKIAGFNVDFNQVEEIDNTIVMTETLARIYTNQKKYEDAIKAYEILSLKFPEKSSFFADQIKMLKSLIKE